MTRKQRVADADLLNAISIVHEHLSKLALMAPKLINLGESITFVETCHHDEALFSDVGFRNRQGTGRASYETFLMLSINRQNTVLHHLVELSAGNSIELRGRAVSAKHALTFWLTTKNLIEDLTCTGKMTRLAFTQSATAFFGLPKPAAEKPSQDARSALIWTLTALVKSNTTLPFEHGNTTLSDNDRIGVPNTDVIEIVYSVWNEVFPQSAITRAVVRNVWQTSNTLRNKQAKSDWDSWSSFAS